MKALPLGRKAGTCAGLLSVCLILASRCFGEESRLQTKISGLGFVEFGQVVNGEFKSRVIDRVWRQRMGAVLRFDAATSERLRVTLALEADSWYPYPQSTVDAGTKTRQWDAYIDRANVRYLVGNTEKPVLEFGAGFFFVKYNPDAKDFGEYLFRTGIHPGYVLNFFDFPATRITGLRATCILFDTLRQEFFLTNENAVVMSPLYDYSLSYLLNYKWHGLFSVGIGAQVTSLLSVDKNQTTVKSINNAYMPEGDRTSPDMLTDSTPGIEYYSAQGVKFMARASFDPKRLIPDGLFHRCIVPKIYCEGALLGVDYYPVFYDSAWHNIPLSQRMPIMAGIEFPLWIMDLSLEGEYYPSKYDNAMDQLMGSGTAAPVVYSGANAQYSPEIRKYNNDDVKWSVYAKKEVVRGLTAILQVARDHYPIIEGKGVPWETIKKPEDLMWFGKIAYAF